MNILIVAAHPDDEVLGCGGTIVRLVNEGHNVYVAIMGEGETSRGYDINSVNNKLVAALHQCSHRVANFFGIKKLIIQNYPDNQFDSVPMLDIVKSIENVIEEIKPEVIFTHHGGDLNIDHLTVHRAVMTSTRTFPGQLVQQVFLFEIPSSTEWAFQQFCPIFMPNYFVDISSSIEEKIHALSIYESESRTFPHPRSSEAIRAIGMRWGSTAGFYQAEAFQLIRAIISPTVRIFQ